MAVVISNLFLFISFFFVFTWFTKQFSGVVSIFERFKPETFGTSLVFLCFLQTLNLVLLVFHCLKKEELRRRGFSFDCVFGFFHWAPLIWIDGGDRYSSRLHERGSMMSPFRFGSSCGTGKLGGSRRGATRCVATLASGESGSTWLDSFFLSSPPSFLDWLPRRSIRPIGRPAWPRGAIDFVSLDLSASFSCWSRRFLTTGFHRVPMILLQVLPIRTWFYWVIPSFTEFYRGLPGFTGFFLMFSGF